jgi:hypothetical protein
VITLWHALGNNVILSIECHRRTTAKGGNVIRMHTNDIYQPNPSTKWREKTQDDIEVWLISYVS